MISQEIDLRYIMPPYDSKNIFRCSTDLAWAGFLQNNHPAPNTESLFSFECVLWLSIFDN